QCHEKRGCSVPSAERLRRTPQDSCIDCHMPRYGSSDIPHTASTDHRILRGGSTAPKKPIAAPPSDVFPVASFYQGRTGHHAAEDDRSRAIAVVVLARGRDPAAQRA